MLAFCKNFVGVTSRLALGNTLRLAKLGKRQQVEHKLQEKADSFLCLAKPTRDNKGKGCFCNY